ncbi:ParB/RepB/Spo0J family partition protein [Clostridium fessum]|uniref:ParB/RepB/Spo0J family partition protein n=1 Tax=Clostridium fessum TaxID=2126740 RepID=UPI002E75A1F5|nr:ParB/RepB/Spo0J family partition protein [Clostridium fessum]
MSKRTGLGRGLGAFFGNDYEDAEAGKSSAKPSDEAGKKTSVRETEQEIEKKSLEELDMVLPGSKKQKKSASAGKTAAKTVGKGNRVGVAKASGKTTTEGKTRTAGETAAKSEPVVKIVEVEKEKFLNISEIEPNVSQPRKMFDEEQLGELAESIRRYGVLQPLLVQKKGDRYELIAGERRWRAAKLAGFREVPVIVREYTRQQTMEIALIENVQRADLNPIEEAKAYQMLIQEFGLRQEDVAERVAKNRATITNSMRLLKLDERVQEMLIQDRLTGGHARALLSLEDGEKQYQLALKTVENHLSVREVERLVKELLKPKKVKKKADPERDMEVFFKDLEEKLKGVMGTKVSINRKDKNKGRIEIEYYSSAELERLIELLESLRQ